MRLDVALQVESVDLEEIVIEAERREELEQATQSSFIALQVEPLQQMPAIGEADLLRSLQLLPGIQSASDISSGLYVRGGGPDQTAILLDHIPLYNPSHMFGFFSTFNPDAIKDVQLYKGAYPAAYGRTLGGGTRREQPRGQPTTLQRPRRHQLNREPLASRRASRARLVDDGRPPHLPRTRPQRRPLFRYRHPLELLLLRLQRQSQPALGRRYLYGEHVLGPRRSAGRCRRRG